jgi:hypothetical protein
LIFETFEIIIVDKRRRRIMDVILPKGFEPGQGRIRTQRGARHAALCVRADGAVYPVLRRWAGGFAVTATDVPMLDGIVDLYEGTEYLHQCLILRSEVVAQDRIFTIRQAGAVDYRTVSETDDAMAVSA